LYFPIFGTEGDLGHLSRQIPHQRPFIRQHSHYLQITANVSFIMLLPRLFINGQIPPRWATAGNPLSAAGKNERPSND